MWNYFLDLLKVNLVQLCINKIIKNRYIGKFNRNKLTKIQTYFFRWPPYHRVHNRESELNQKLILASLALFYFLLFNMKKSTKFGSFFIKSKKILNY